MGKQQKTKQLQVMVFVEGDTDEVFFKSLLDYYRSVSQTELLPCRICNLLKRILLIAFAAMLSMGVLSCNKDEVIPDTGNSNSGNQEEEPSVEWVDLGLPSGLLWAKCNLGAAAPEEYGGNYSWGETAQKEAYDWSHYRYCTVDSVGELKSLTKYNTRSSYGAVDSLTILEATDDAATAVLGNGARIPTKKEWQELMDNTIAEWTTQNGVGGRKFTAANGNSIFLPAAGRRHGSELEYDGSYGIYWSASLVEDQPSRAWRFIFNSDDQSMSNCRRCNGPAVRPVRSALYVRTNPCPQTGTGKRKTSGCGRSRQRATQPTCAAKGTRGYHFVTGGFCTSAGIFY